MEEGFQNFPADWYLEVQSHRKALDPDSTVMIKELFEGAETVHLKVSRQHLPGGSCVKKTWLLHRCSMKTTN